MKLKTPLVVAFGTGARFSDGEEAFMSDSREVAKELVRRANIHDELVEAVMLLADDVYPDGIRDLIKKARGEK